MAAEQNPQSPVYNPQTPPGYEEEWTVGSPQKPQPAAIDFGEKELNDFYETLTESNKTQIRALRNPRDQKMILKKVKDKYDAKRENIEKTQKPQELHTTEILEIQEPKSEEEEEKENDGKENHEKDNDEEKNNTNEQSGGTNTTKKTVSFHL